MKPMTPLEIELAEAQRAAYRLGVQDRLRYTRQHSDLAGVPVVLPNLGSMSVDEAVRHRFPIRDQAPRVVPDPDSGVWQLRVNGRTLETRIPEHSRYGEWKPVDELGIVWGFSQHRARVIAELFAHPFEVVNR